MKELRVTTQRYCEECKITTTQKVEVQTWHRILLKCLNVIGENGRCCGFKHIFTLSHVGTYPYGPMKPFERVTFKVGVSGLVVIDEIREPKYQRSKDNRTEE